jgi:hypothetical protein
MISATKLAMLDTDPPSSDNVCAVFAAADPGVAPEAVGLGGSGHAPSHINYGDCQRRARALEGSTVMKHKRLNPSVALWEGTRAEQSLARHV